MNDPTITASAVRAPLAPLKERDAAPLDWNARKAQDRAPRMVRIYNRENLKEGISFVMSDASKYLVHETGAFLSYGKDRRGFTVKERKRFRREARESRESRNQSSLEKLNVQ